MREGLRDTARARAGMRATWHDVAQPGENGRNLERTGATWRERAQPGETGGDHARPCASWRDRERPCAAIRGHPRPYGTRRGHAQLGAILRKPMQQQGAAIMFSPNTYPSERAKTGQPIRTEEEDRQDIAPDVISRSPSRL